MKSIVPCKELETLMIDEKWRVLKPLQFPNKITLRPNDVILQIDDIKRPINSNNSNKFPSVSQIINNVNSNVITIVFIRVCLFVCLFSFFFLFSGILCMYNREQF